MSAESRRGCFWVVGFWRGQGHDGGGGGGGGVNRVIVGSGVSRPG